MYTTLNNIISTLQIMLKKKNNTRIMGKTPSRTILALVQATVLLIFLQMLPSEAVTNRARILPHPLLMKGGRRFISQGQEAMQGEFPYQISLQTNDYPGESLCGGVIVDKRTIVTAAHCVFPSHYQFKIIAGNVNLKSRLSIQERHVARIYVHPEFIHVGPVVENDIAVLILRVPLEFNEYVQAIALPTDESYPSGEAIVSGWGSIKADRDQYPDLQHFAEVPLMTAVACEAAIEREEYLGLNSDLVLCSGPHTRYSYPAKVQSGDSGGGLVQNGTLIGIVSWGDGDIAVYTRVSKYSNWIQEKKATQNVECQYKGLNDHNDL